MREDSRTCIPHTPARGGGGGREKVREGCFGKILWQSFHRGESLGVFPLPTYHQENLPGNSSPECSGAIYRVIRYCRGIHHKLTPFPVTSPQQVVNFRGEEGINGHYGRGVVDSPAPTRPTAPALNQK